MGRATPRLQTPQPHPDGPVAASAPGSPRAKPPEKPYRSPRNKMSSMMLEQQRNADTCLSWIEVPARPMTPTTPRASSRTANEDVHFQATVQGGLERLLNDHLKEMRSVLGEEMRSVLGEEMRSVLREELESEGLRNGVKVKAAPAVGNQAEQSAAPSEYGPVNGKDRKRASLSRVTSITGSDALRNEETTPELAGVQVEPDPPVPMTLTEAITHLFPAAGKNTRWISDRLSVFGKGAAPKRTDLVSRFVDSATFKLCIYVVIFVNVGFMVYSANEEVAQYKTGKSDFVQTTELVFVIIYTLELVLRLWRSRMYFWYDAEWKWNWLDAFLILICYYLLLLDGAFRNVGWLRMLRLLKLTKVLRVFRVVTMFKTLRAILLSLVNTISTLFWSMVMLYIIIFMFALTFTILVGNWLGQQGEDLDEVVTEPLLMYFRTVNDSSLALYACVTGGNDWSVYYDALSVTGMVGPYLLLVYIFFTQVAVMNIILGMFVNQAIDNMKPTREEAAKEHAQEMRIRDKDLCDIIRSADMSGDGVISIDEWRTTMKTGNVPSYLDLCGFRPGDVHEYYKMLYKEAQDGRVNMEDFVDGCLHLKGRASKFDMHLLACNLQELKEQIDLLVRG